MNYSLFALFGQYELFALFIVSTMFTYRGRSICIFLGLAKRPLRIVRKEECFFLVIISFIVLSS